MKSSSGCLAVRSLTGAAFIAVALASVGCAGREEDELHLAVVRDGVQIAWVGSSESVTTTGVNLLQAGSQSKKGRSTGVIRLPVANGIKYSCGVTFVGRHYAITAAHCVDDQDVALGQQVVVEQYDTTALSVNTLIAQGRVTGSWPDYRRQTKLSPANGYIVKSMTCKVETRCHTPGTGDGQYGRESNCPFSQTVDIALLRCDNRPSSQLDYVKVASSDPRGAVEVWWFHEVLNMQTSTALTNPYQPANNWAHYGQYIKGNLGTNYHYFHSAADTDQQPLPLVSKHTSSNQQYRALSGLSALSNVKTTLPVCHGTSGSGFFRAGTDEFLGVTVEFGTAGNGDFVLCENMTDASEANGSAYTQVQFAQSLVTNLVPASERP
jgi:hypothetical protein